MGTTLIITIYVVEVTQFAVRSNRVPLCYTEQRMRVNSFIKNRPQIVQCEMKKQLQEGEPENPYVQAVLSNLIF